MFVGNSSGASAGEVVLVVEAVEKPWKSIDYGLSCSALNTGGFGSGRGRKTKVANKNTITRKAKKIANGSTLECTLSHRNLFGGGEVLGLTSSVVSTMGHQGLNIDFRRWFGKSKKNLRNLNENHVDDSNDSNDSPSPKSDNNIFKGVHKLSYTDDKFGDVLGYGAEAFAITNSDEEEDGSSRNENENENENKTNKAISRRGLKFTLNKPLFKIITNSNVKLNAENVVTSSSQPTELEGEGDTTSEYVTSTNLEVSERSELRWVKFLGGGGGRGGPW